jgi:hypothetical protein
VEQLSLDGAFVRADLAELGELERWDRTLDLFAACGAVDRRWLGSVRAQLFAGLGLVRYWRGEMILTERGADAEAERPWPAWRRARAARGVRR